MTTNGSLDGSEEAVPPAPSGRAPRVKRRARTPRGTRNRTASDELRGERTIADAAQDIYKRAIEAVDYGKTLLEIQQDRAGLAIRRKTTQLLLIAIGVCVGITWLINSTLLVIHGVAEGLTVWFAGRSWLGNLVAGLLLLGIAGAFIGTSLRRRDKVQLSKQVKKYEQRRNEHRARHGRYVADDAGLSNRGSPPGLGGAAGARGTGPQFE